MIKIETQKGCSYLPGVGELKIDERVKVNVGRAEFYVRLRSAAGMTEDIRKGLLLDPTLQVGPGEILKAVLQECRKHAGGVHPEPPAPFACTLVRKRS